MGGLQESCKYSFQDLFEAAFGQKVTPAEIQEFQNLPQEEKNRRVRIWAKIADWNFLDERGPDGKVYTAFYPKWGKRIF